MKTFMKSVLGKSIHMVLAVSFVGLDIAPVIDRGHDARSEVVSCATLAAPSAFLKEPVNPETGANGRSFVADASLLGSSCAIAKVLLEDGLRLRNVESTMSMQLGDAAGGISLKQVSAIVMRGDAIIPLDRDDRIPPEAIILVPYERDNRDRVISVALADNPAIKGLPGYRVTQEGKYAVKDLPREYAAKEFESIIGSVTAELAKRREYTPRELFDAVRSRVPGSMARLMRALDSVAPLASRETVSAGKIAAAVDAARADYSLSSRETAVVRLALMGPGQGMGVTPFTEIVPGSLKRMATIRDVVSRKLFLLELNTGFGADGKPVSFEGMEGIASLLAAGKRVALYSNDRSDRVVPLIEQSIRDYIRTKQRFENGALIDLAAFGGCYLYTAQGRKKYALNTSTGSFDEVLTYRQRFAMKEAQKRRICDLIDADPELRGKGEMKRFTYTRADGQKEEYYIYGLTDDEAKRIRRIAREWEETKGRKSSVLIKAIPEALRDEKGPGRVIINMSESPSIFYMAFGMQDRARYYEWDPDFKKRLAIIDRIRKKVADDPALSGLVVELGGSRAIGIGFADKEQVLLDAQQTYGVKPGDSVVVGDFSVLEENIPALVRDPAVACVNIGTTIAEGANPLLQLKELDGNLGSLFWLTLLLETKKTFNEEQRTIFVERLVDVYELLLNHPEMASEDIADYLKITKEELVGIYRYIADREGLRRPLVENSRYRNHTIPMREMLRYKSRIERIIRGETVYPVILEMHLGPFCTSDCVMCFSHGSDYQQAVSNRAHTGIKHYREMLGKEKTSLQAGKAADPKSLRQTTALVMKILAVIGADEPRRQVTGPRLEEALAVFTDIDAAVTRGQAVSVDDLQRAIDVLGRVQETLLPFKEELTLDEIVALLTDAKANGTEEIWFSGGREPLTARTAVKAIAIATEMGFKVRLYTNGEMLGRFFNEKDEADPDRYVRALLRCEQVRISMNAATPETYGKIHFPKPLRPGDAFANVHDKEGADAFPIVVENVARLIKERNDRRADPAYAIKPRVKIALSQIIQPLNCHELTAFFDMARDLGADSIQIRAESVGAVAPFTQEQKENILAQVRGLTRQKELGLFGDLEFDLRGLSAEDLDASKQSEQFLTGMRKASLCRAGAFKRGINPWGVVYNCEYSMHPQNASDEEYRKNGTEIGDLRKEPFGAVMDRMAGRALLNRCPQCQAHEYGMNITLEKFVRDTRYGIPVTDQPYFNEYDYLGNVAVIGVGGWAERTAIPAILQALPGAKIFGVARSHYEKMRKAFASNGRVCIRRADELDSVLADETVKTVVITSSFASHYALVKRALEAGKDVFVEKPFTTTAAEARELTGLARAKGRILSVGYEYMNEPDFFKMREVLASGVIGNVTGVHFKMLNNVGERKLDYSSNVVEDLAGHQLSMLMAFFGQQRITGLDCAVRGDSAAITMNYNGKAVTIDLDRDYKGPWSRQIEFSGDNGRIVLDYASVKREVSFRIYDKNGVEIAQTDPRFPALLRTKLGGTFLAAEFSLFFDAVRTRNQPYNSAEVGTRITELTEELNAAAAAKLSPAEAWRYVKEFHWDFNLMLRSRWHARMRDAGVFAYTLDGARSRTVGGYTAVDIPGRGMKRKKEEAEAPASVRAAFDDSAFHFSRIPPDSGERLFSATLPSGAVDIFVNKNPIADGHFIMVPEPDKRRSQYLETRGLKTALELAALSGSEALKLVYNSRGAYASVNQDHFQGFYYRGTDGASVLPIERAQREPISEDGGVTVSGLTGYPANALVFSGADLPALADAVAGYVKILQDRNIPHNLLISGSTVYVMPVRFEEAYVPSEVDCLVAGSEMSGYFVCMREGLLESVTAETIRDAIAQRTVSPGVLSETVETWKKLSDMKSALTGAGAVSDPGPVADRLDALSVAEVKALAVLMGFGQRSVAGKFVTYSGSSGAGKSSIWDIIIRDHPDMFEKALLYTTRDRHFKELASSAGARYALLKEFIGLDIDQKDFRAKTRAFLDALGEHDAEMVQFLRDTLAPLFDTAVYGRTVSKEELLALDEDGAIRIYNEFHGVQYNFVTKEEILAMKERGEVLTVQVKEAFQGFPLKTLVDSGAKPVVMILETDKGLLQELSKEENKSILIKAGIDPDSLGLPSFFVTPLEREDLGSRARAYPLEALVRELCALLVWSNGDKIEEVVEADLLQVVLRMRNQGVAKLLERFSAADIRRVIELIMPGNITMTAEERIGINDLNAFLRSGEIDKLRKAGYLSSSREALLQTMSLLSPGEVNALFRLDHVLLCEMTRRLKRRSNDANKPFVYDAKSMERIGDALEENFFAILNDGGLIEESIVNAWKDDGIPDAAADALLRKVLGRIVRNLASERNERPDAIRLWRTLSAYPVFRALAERKREPALPIADEFAHVELVVSAVRALMNGDDAFLASRTLEGEQGKTLDVDTARRFRDVAARVREQAGEVLGDDPDRQYALALMPIVHDIGKADMDKVIDGKLITFDDHGARGAEILDAEIFNRFERDGYTIPDAVKRMVRFLVRYHSAFGEIYLAAHLDGTTPAELDRAIGNAEGMLAEADREGLDFPSVMTMLMVNVFGDISQGMLEAEKIIRQFGEVCRYADRKYFEGVRDGLKAKRAATGGAAGAEASVNRAGQLFAIVDGMVNNERAAYVDAANRLDAELGSDAPAAREPFTTAGITADIIAGADRTVRTAEERGAGRLSDEARAAAETLRRGADRIEADSIVASIIVKAREAKRHGQTFIIAYETDWIPGLDTTGYGTQRDAIGGLLDEIETLEATLRSMGLDNVRILHEKKAELAAAVLALSEKTGTNLSNVVVLASEETAKLPGFEKLASTAGEARAFLALVDPARLVEAERAGRPSGEIAVEIVEMLSITLELACGKVDPRTPLVKEYNKELRRVLFLPKAELNDYEKVRDGYRAKLAALTAA